MGPCIKCWQATIIAAISEKADMTGGESPTSSVAQCRQVSNHLEKYLLQSEWDIFMSTTVSHEKKLLAMGQVLERLFLLHPSEPTAAAAASIALCSDGPHPVDFMLAKLRSLKQYLSVCCSKSKPITATLPSIYPECIADFAKEHSAFYASAFAGGAPAPCPIECTRLAFLKANAPCRSSRSGCSGSLPEHQKSVRTSVVAIQAGLGFHAARSSPNLPGFQWTMQQQQPVGWELHPGHNRPLHPYEMPQMLQQRPLALMDKPPPESDVLAAPAAPLPPAPVVLGHGLQPHSDDSQQDGATAGAAVAAVGLGSGPQSAKISELVEKWQKKATEAKASASNPPKEAKAKAKANTTAKTHKSKAKAKTNKSKAKAKTTAVKKRKTTNAKTKPKIVAMAVPGKKLILGCAKCRGNSGGCSQCRNPKFSGGRGPR